MLESHLDVKSYGTGNSCKLPGKKQNQPNIYPYETATYQEIYEDLEKQDLEFYTNNGLIKMVDRNRKIKERPERFQVAAREHHFDVIICCEERVYDAVIEDLVSREHSKYPVHVVNVEIKDNAEQASVGGQIIKEIALRFEESPNIHVEGFKILTEMRAKYTKTRFMYCVSIN